MPTIKDTSATTALNDDKYINKLYDTAGSRQQDILKENYGNSQNQLTAGQTANQKLTDYYLGRTKAESPGVNNGAYQKLYGAGTPAGWNAQAGLSFGNQNQKNVSALTDQQKQADMEYERRRKELGDMYAAEIKKAQADNDMERAQKLYEAAKMEEERLRELRQKGADLMLSAKDDMSIWESIANGDPVKRDTTTESWGNVFKNEEGINKIYDAMMEGQKIKAEMERDQALSELDAQRQAQTRKTDASLNSAYVEALRSGKNAMETQNAYGQSSGIKAQDQMARANQLTGKLTDLRLLEGQAQEGFNKKGQDIWRDYGKTMSGATQETERKRLDELYKSASDEEKALIDEQLAYGNIMAGKGDYTVLGKLYGLTDEQIAALNRPSGGGGGDGGSSGGGGDGGSSGGGGDGGSSGGGRTSNGGKSPPHSTLPAWDQVKENTNNPFDHHLKYPSLPGTRK